MKDMALQFAEQHAKTPRKSVYKKVHTLQAYRGSRRMVPFILNLCMHYLRMHGQPQPQLLYLQGKDPPVLITQQPSKAPRWVWAFY